MAKNNSIDVQRGSRSMNPFRSIFPEFDQMAEHFFGGNAMAEMPNIIRAPKMDLKESADAFMVTAEMPGIPKNAIDVQVSGNVLTLKGEEEQKKEDKEQGYTRNYRSFYQSITLPTNVDASKLEAHYDDGVLELWIPKTSNSQPRKVELQSGKGGFSKRLFGKDKKSESESAQKH